MKRRSQLYDTARLGDVKVIDNPPVGQTSRAQGSSDVCFDARPFIGVRYAAGKAEDAVETGDAHLGKIGEPWISRHGLASEKR